MTILEKIDDFHKRNHRFEIEDIPFDSSKRKISMKKLRWFQSFRKISGLRTPVCLKPNKNDMFAQKSSFICLFLSKQVDFWLKITILTENYHYFWLLEIFKPLRGRNDDFSVDETSLVELISCNGSENGNFYWFCHFWTKLGIFEQKNTVFCR